MPWQSNMGGSRAEVQEFSKSHSFSMLVLELSPPTTSVEGFRGPPCTKTWLNTDGNLQTISSAHAYNFCFLQKAKGLAHSPYFAKLNTLILHVCSCKHLWSNKKYISKQSIWKCTTRHGINQDTLSETGMVSKKLKQDFLKIQRSLKDILQKKKTVKKSRH